MRKLDKKGQVSNLAPAILALVFAGILLVFGVVIVQSLRDSDVIRVTKTITNESQSSDAGGTYGIAYINETSNYTLVTEVADKTGCFSITEVLGDYNQSNGTGLMTNLPAGYNTTIDAGNYSIVASTGEVSSNVSATASIYNFSNVTISYTYCDGDEAYLGANDTLTGLGTFTDFWEIIVLAVVISLVMGLLLVAFGGRKPR